MRGDLVYELIGGIREDFVREAEPMCLLKLWDPSEEDGAQSQTESSVTYLVTDSRSSPKKSSRSMRRWLAAACIALAILVVGTGSMALIGGLASSGDVGVSSIFGFDFIYQLFPFLAPDETEESQESEAEPETDTTTQEGEHTWQMTASEEATCFIGGHVEYVCDDCGATNTVYTEPLGHEFVDGFCNRCSLIEGAVDCSSTVDGDLLNATGEKGAKISRVNSVSGSEAVLPNVVYVEDYGVLPVTAIGSWVLYYTEGKEQVTRVVIPDSVRRIMKDAFANLNTLEEVVWPAALETIDASAFQDTALRTAQIPEGVTFIGEHAFISCKSLMSLSLPSTLRTLESDAFIGCIALKELVFHTGSFTMGEAVFRGCTSLEAVSLPEGLEVLGSNSFENCTALREVVFPSTLTDTGRYSFRGCTSLTTVILPDGIAVGDSCFQGCSAMMSVTLPPNTGRIGDSAFKDTGLCELIAEGNIEYFDSEAFANTNLTSVTIPGFLRSVNKECFSGTPLRELVVLGSCDEGGIGFNAFAHHPTLERVILPDGMTLIASSAFEGCQQLRELRLPDSVEVIYEKAFRGCTALTEIRLPASLQFLRESAFENCTALRSVDVSAMNAINKEWQRCVFRGCSALESMQVPGGILKLEEWLFQGCTSLTNISLPLSLNSIEYGALSGTGITEIVIPKKVTLIDNDAFSGSALREVSFLCPGDQLTMGGAFQDCAFLETVNLPEGLNYLAPSTFAGCTALKEIHVPSSVGGIDCFAFEDCTSLEILHLPAGLESIHESAVIGCPNLREVRMDGEGERYKVLDHCMIIDKKYSTLLLCTADAIIPADEGITRICAQAFDGRPFHSIVIPEGITVIESGAFQNCTVLKTVKISGSVKTVERELFSSCTALEEVVFSEGVTTLKSFLFHGCSSLRAVHLPSSVSSLEENPFETCESLQAVYLDGNVGKWQALTRTYRDKNPGFTVYCNNGMIHPDGSVTLYE